MSLRRRREFGWGRHHAREALRHLGFAPVAILSRDRAPLWPSGVVGSISHSSSDRGAAALNSVAGHLRDLANDPCLECFCPIISFGEVGVNCSSPPMRPATHRHTHYREFHHARPLPFIVRATVPSRRALC
ncbi:hypothetical protein [Mesorhizobium sp. 128a]